MQACQPRKALRQIRKGGGKEDLSRSRYLATAKSRQFFCVNPSLFVSDCYISQIFCPISMQSALHILCKAPKYVSMVYSLNMCRYTFTELASGGDLMSFIYRHDTVKEFDTRILIRQVIRGLRYLHDKGIVHRDLKPENILLAFSPKIAYHRIMLSDFGTSAVPRRSRMMTNVGTMEYKAPYVMVHSLFPNYSTTD